MAPAMSSSFLMITRLVLTTVGVERQFKFIGYKILVFKCKMENVGLWEMEFGLIDLQ